MTNQEVFDKVAKHLLTQNKKAISPVDGRCKYRTEDLKCAGGIMIPDDKYLPKMEGRSMSTVIKENSLEELKPFMLLLDQLQGIHDVYFPSEWKVRLGRFAESNNLSTAALD